MNNFMKRRVSGKSMNMSIETDLEYKSRNNVELKESLTTPYANIKRYLANNSLSTEYFDRKIQASQSPQPPKLDFLRNEIKRNFSTNTMPNQAFSTKISERVGSKLHDLASQKMSEYLNIDN